VAQQITTENLNSADFPMIQRFRILNMNIGSARIILVLNHHYGWEQRAKSHGGKDATKEEVVEGQWLLSLFITLF